MLLKNNPITKMSVTIKILKSINYKDVINKRRVNFNFLSKNLDPHNELKFKINKSHVPMCYPFLKHNSEEILNRLIKNKIFVEKYWPNVELWCEKTTFEFYLANNNLALPIDHRYNIDDMKRIVKIILDK